MSHKFISEYRIVTPAQAGVQAISCLVILVSGLHRNDGVASSWLFVSPAQAGVQAVSCLVFLDAGVRRHDELTRNS